MVRLPAALARDVVERGLAVGEGAAVGVRVAGGGDADGVVVVAVEAAEGRADGGDLATEVEAVGAVVGVIIRGEDADGGDG